MKQTTDLQNKKDELAKESAFCLKHDISPKMLFLLKLVFFSKIELALFHCAPKKEDPYFTREEVNRLYKKEFLTQKWQITDTYPSLLETSPDRLEELCFIFGVQAQDLDKAFEVEKKQKAFIADYASQLIKTYPAEVSGVLLTACNPFTFEGKEYAGKDQTIALYAEIIKYDTLLHKKIIHKIKEDSKNSYKFCRQKITSFITNRVWEEMPEPVKTFNFTV